MPGNGIDYRQSRGSICRQRVPPSGKKLSARITERRPEFNAGRVAVQDLSIAVRRLWQNGLRQRNFAAIAVVADNQAILILTQLRDGRRQPNSDGDKNECEYHG